MAGLSSQALHVQISDFKRMRLNGTCIDLFSMYKSVTSMGGYPTEIPMQLDWCQTPLSVAAQMRNWSADEEASREVTKVPIVLSWSALCDATERLHL